MTQGTYTLQVAFTFRGTADIKADSKKKAKEILKSLFARIGTVQTADNKIVDWNIELITQAEEEY